MTEQGRTPEAFGSAPKGARRGQGRGQRSLSRPSQPRDLPAWTRWPVTLFVVVWLPSWWVLLGPANFSGSPISLYVRILFGVFYLSLPPLLVYLVYLVWRLGYEPRALPAQSVVAWVVLPLSRYFGTADSNLNWTYGLGEYTPFALPPAIYVGLLMILFPLLAYLPTDRLLRRLPTSDRATLP